MTGYLLEHMIEEAETGGDVGVAIAVEVKRDADIRLAGSAGDGGSTQTGEDDVGNALPSADDGAMAFGQRPFVRCRAAVARALVYDESPCIL